MLILIDSESSVRKQTDMKHFLIIHKKNIGWFIIWYIQTDVTNYIYVWFFFFERPAP